ncbi:hypothetical protein [Pseudoneobacillus rhizosphaerae]|uniref:Uncharacterized protein n=1 Tax=Pseudoneobacillus rhizosphaerae TaxID=2880968 RepID=A0A9C7GDV9_9BACI|nr:hypothetical protein [Pseudoneobacillus rhizosphaerae]CAG9610538.1 hypothetical protein NEOCIP111885_04313 [Pseudoneobacillus rhizosphaerae]
MSKENQNKLSTNEANLKINDRFNDFNERFSSEVISNSDEANQEIQEQFYDNTEEKKIIYSPYMSQ